MTETIAIIISMLALMFSAFTFFWKDMTRVEMRLWVPPLHDPEFIALEGEDHPYVSLINHSPFDVRVRRLLFRIIVKRKTFKRTRYSNLPIPLSPSDMGSLPHTIGARQSHRVQLDRTDLREMYEQSSELLAELDTLKLIKLKRADRKKFKKYLDSARSSFALARQSTQ